MSLGAVLLWWSWSSSAEVSYKEHYFHLSTGSYPTLYPFPAAQWCFATLLQREEEPIKISACPVSKTSFWWSNFFPLVSSSCRFSPSPGVTHSDAPTSPCRAQCSAAPSSASACALPSEEQRFALLRCCQKTQITGIPCLAMWALPSSPNSLPILPPFLSLSLSCSQPLLAPEQTANTAAAGPGSSSPLPGSAISPSLCLLWLH